MSTIEISDSEEIFMDLMSEVGICNIFQNLSRPEKDPQFGFLVDAHNDAFQQMRSFCDMVLKMESPIERLLFWTMIKRWGVFDCKGGSALNRKHTSFVKPQAEITIGSNSYRCDFLIWYGDGKKEVLICVEADGHNFHERTKEQARHDKARDRKMQAAGYFVFRFTGSEIWRDPERVVDELDNFLSGL